MRMQRVGGHLTTMSDTRLTDNAYEFINVRHQQLQTNALTA